MDANKFGELCEGTAAMLTALAKQATAPTAAGELHFQIKAATPTIVPLAQIIEAIAEGAS